MGVVAQSLKAICQVGVHALHRKGDNSQKQWQCFNIIPPHNLYSWTVLIVVNENALVNPLISFWVCMKEA